MYLIIINSGQKEFLRKCIDSLIDTTDGMNFDLRIIKEGKYREATLSKILKDYNDQDILIFGDDIIFTPGWFESLVANMGKGDIIGFSMLYPDTDIVQDTGYDLVAIDGEIFLKPQNRGKKKNEIEKFNNRECDALNGCAMFIKNRVIKKIAEFPKEGKNRWGEFLYANEAKNKGFRVIVLDHYLYHYGVSTKVNPDKSFSSESYLAEKELWSDIVKKYINKDRIKIRCQRKLSDKLREILSREKNILFYGAGTVTKFIYENLEEILSQKHVDICSGLPEEEKKPFCGKKLLYSSNVEFDKYGIIIITVFQKEKKIFELIKNKVRRERVYYISQKTLGDDVNFDIKPYE